MAEVDKREVLKNAMARASKLIQLESNGTLNKIAKGHRDDIGSSFNDANVTTASMMTTARDRAKEAPMVGGNFSSAASKIPSAILESFAKQPSANDSAMLSSVLGDGKDISFLTEGLPKQQSSMSSENVRQLVNEGIVGQSIQTNAQGNVDYPMIRTIVEDIVRKYAQALNKKMINESKTPNTVNAIMLGKTFKFVSEDGTLYECTMKKVGNLKEKKQ